MKLSKISVALITSVSLFSACGAYAADEESATTAVVTTQGGTVHFIGSLVNAACAVSTDSADQIVNLGQYRTASMAGVGTTSATIPFTIVLNDCDTEVATTAKVAFSGQLASGNNQLLAVSSSDNTATATGVGIQILDEDSSAMTPDGSTFSKGHTLIDGTNTLNFSARYVSTAATPTAGQANADAVFTMQYQ